MQEGLPSKLEDPYNNREKKTLKKTITITYVLKYHFVTPLARMHSLRFAKTKIACSFVCSFTALPLWPVV